MVSIRDCVVPPGRLKFKHQMVEQEENFISRVKKEEDLIKPYAHKKNKQGKDVLAEWRDLMLSDEVEEGIKYCKFQYPSQIQYKAIPKITSRERKDFLCQAKSGTGKTNVFLISLLEMLAFDYRANHRPEYLPHLAIIITNTRELAHQINKALRNLLEVSNKKGGATKLNIGVFFGGIAVQENIATLQSKTNCPHIIIGTLGRLKHLFNEKHIIARNIKFFIVDECDSIMSSENSKEDLKELLRKTPEDKQIMMFSATLPTPIKKECLSLMKPKYELLQMEEDEDIRLPTLDHFFDLVKEEDKFDRLNVLLDKFPFDQAVIFVNTVERAKTLTSMLETALFHPLCIHSSMLQEDRLQAFDQFKHYSFPIMVATDVIGRGMDVQHLNVVFNYDFPREAETYVHRAARAGRFGKRGKCISLVSNGSELTPAKNDMRVMEKASELYNFSFQPLPKEINPYESV